MDLSLRHFVKLLLTDGDMSQLRMGGGVTQGTSQVRKLNPGGLSSEERVLFQSSIYSSSAKDLRMPGFSWDLGTQMGQNPAFVLRGFIPQQEKRAKPGSVFKGVGGHG